jgi:ATP-dependent DNA helicase RecQ
VADIADKLQMRSPAIFKRSFSRDNISYIVRRVDVKDNQLLRVLNGTTGTAIVYVRSRRNTGQIAQMLQQNGISADFYHAGLSSEEKTAKQDAWKSGAVRVIVATNAFGMGIDKPDVRTVVHYDVPPSLEEYYQEAGRAGRDGLPSFAVMLVSQADKGLMKRRLSENFPGREYLLTVYEKLGNFLDVAVGGGYNQVYECNFTVFCKRFDLQPRPTLAALRILTRAGAIEFNDDQASRSRVMIIIDKRDFYSLQLDERTDRILQALLRNYTGLFADFVNIDEVHLAYQTSSTPQIVYDALLLLSRIHVLSYIPKRTTPFVYYPTSRDLPKHVVIPREVYEVQLERSTKRMEAMRDYAFDDAGCRVQRMLRYFGDENAKPCGKCDICRAESRRLHAVDHRKSTESRLKAMLQAEPNGISLAALRQAFPDSLSEAIDILRQAVDNATLSYRDGVYKTL